MIDVAVSVAEPVVSRANNRRKLELIDADISPSLKAVIISEDQAKDLSSKIVCAGVLMLAIQRDDPDAWSDFKNADPKAKEITCKGDGARSREVATVLWREYRAIPSRERISMYGKAIRIAHDAYYETVTTRPDELLTRIVNAGGVKGLIAIAKVSKGTTKPRRIMLDRPVTLTVIITRPDGTYEPVPVEIARRLLIEMGELQ